ncbi:MBG domain-containing protein [Chitinophaga jiangningensis]|uniref:MBG domain-containing protein n=1 Tax=Chitinophaga jiangningensis TaxID=1419482 RepID=UPI0015B54CB2|nr:MBG domain-containing protein [Chitinophaga jiangningensis]
MITLFFICCTFLSQAQISPGDLVFTGYNSFDDDIDGNTQNDVFSFVFLKNIPGNTVIYFTDLGRISGGFQSLSCSAGEGSNTDGVIRWTAPATGLLAGKQIVIKGKYNPATSYGTVDAISPTKNSAGAILKEYISLGLTGDQLFAFTSSNGNPGGPHTVIAGINVNKAAWDASLESCDFTSSMSVSPTATATLKLPSILAVNGRYNCNRIIGTSAILRGLLTDAAQWSKDNTFATSYPASFNLLTTPPCDLTIVNPDAAGVVRVDINTTTPGDGTTWTNPVKELRDALVAAADPASGIKQIWVAKGTYYPSGIGDINAAFVIPTGVGVYGGFKGGAGGETTLAARTPADYPVILSGDLDNDDVNKVGGMSLNSADLRGGNTLQLVKIGKGAINVVLDNLIITGANNPGDNAAAVASENGLASENYQINYCRLQGNNAAQGSAVYLRNASGTTANISGCLITGNGGVALSAIGSNTFKIQNSTITRNSYGLNCNTAAVTVTNSIIAGNSVADVQVTGTTPVYQSSMIQTSFYNSSSATDAALSGAVLFKDPATGDFRLDTSNVIINNGNNALTTLTTDLDGKPRISNVTVDPGAYEYQALVQTFTFAPATTSYVYGAADVAFVPAPATNGGGAIIITSSAPGIAQIVNNNLTARGAGNATITAKAAATRGYLESAPVTIGVTVTPKPLFVTADDVTRAYGQPNPTVPALTWSGFAFTDGPSIFTPATTVDYAGTSETSAPGEYPLSPRMNGATNPNYLVTPANGKLTIVKAAQTITLPAVITKTYGDAAFDPGVTATSGLPVTYTILSGPATVNGTMITITGAGTVTVRADQAGNTNYNPATDNFSIQINKAVVNITANNAQRPYNDVNPTFTYTLGTLVNGDNASVITGLPALTTVATQASDAGDYDINVDVGTLQAANYTFNFIKGRLTITRLNQFISFDNLVNRTYGDAPFTISATTTSGLPLTYTVSSGPLTINGNTGTISGVGNVTVVASQAGNTNYNAGTVSQSFTISKAPLKVVADNKSSAYGAALAPLTYHYEGFVYGENESILGGTPSVTSTVAANSNVGTYPITIGTGAVTSANYAVTSQNGVYTIGTASQTISFSKPADKTYGDLPFSLTGTASSGLPLVYTVVSGPATVNGSTLTITGAGAVEIEAIQPGNSNYDAATAVRQTFTVNKAVLNVTGDNKTRLYGEANPTFTFAINGYKNGEDATVVTGAPVLSTSADAASAVGSYDIDVALNTLDAANYTFNFIKGRLTILQAQQTMSFPPITDKTYGDAAFTPSASVNTGLPLVFTVSGPATVNNNIITITGAGTITVTATQAGTVNYLPATGSQTFTVQKAALTVTADDQRKNFNEQVAALTYQITGFVNNETSAVLTGQPALSTPVGTSTPLGTYPINITANTLAAQNYTFTLVPGTYTVGKGTQVITFNQPADVTYGVLPFALNPVSNSGLPVSYRVVSGPATLNNSLITINGAGDVTVEAYQDGNVSWEAATPVSHTFHVAKATVDISVGNYYRTYAQGDPTFGFFINGLVNGDPLTVITGAPVITPVSTPTSDVGVYDVDVAIGTLQADNYNFNLVKGTITISPNNQSINFAPLANKTYGDAAIQLDAPASSELPVTYEVTGPATVNGNVLTITGAGTVTVTAKQAGDKNWLAATPRQQSFTVAPAVLTVTADAQQKLYGAANPVLTYHITGFVNNETAAVLTGTPALTTTAVANSGVGTYPITVALNTLSAANYTFVMVNGTLTVGRNSQTINFTPPTDKTYGDAPFALSASSSSGLPVTFAVKSGPAAISGNLVTITGAGNVVITANQAGNTNFNAAAEAGQSFVVNKAAITVAARNAEKTYDGQAYTGGNGVDVNGLVNNETPSVLGAVTYAGSSQGAVNTGTYTLKPVVADNNNYTISITDGVLTIKKAKQTITFNVVTNKNEGDPAFTLQATSTSGLPVSFASGNTNVISVTGNIGTVVAAGTVVLTATQAGDQNYEPAAAVAQTVTVTAYPVPDLTPNGPLDFCEQGSVTLTASAAPAYAWTKDGVRIPGATTSAYKVTSSGTYQVYALYPGNQEKASVAITVTVYPLPVVTVQAAAPTTISKGETITLSASGGGTYTWEPAAGLSNRTGAITNARPAKTTDYKVVVTSDHGCVASATITITVKDDYKLESSNLLTPNGDGRNDYWVVKNIDMYPENEVKIFDRAGRMVFQQRSYSNKWNGTVNGHPLMEGTYYYIIDLGAGKPQFKGFITIIHD